MGRVPPRVVGIHVTRNDASLGEGCIDECSWDCVEVGFSLMFVVDVDDCGGFIYLFINHTAWSPRAMAGIERKTTITSSKADTRKQTVKLNKGNPPLSRRPPLSVCSRSHKFHSVVVVAPSQGPLRWCPSRYPSSFSWPYAWALPLEFTRLRVGPVQRQRTPICETFIPAICSRGCASCHKREGTMGRIYSQDSKGCRPTS